MIGSADEDTATTAIAAFFPLVAFAVIAQWVGEEQGRTEGIGECGFGLGGLGGIGRGYSMRRCFLVSEYRIKESATP